MSADHAHPEEHDNHGQTPAAWTAVAIILLGVLAGSIAILINSWPLFYIGGVGLVVLGAVVGKVMGLMGYGAHPRASHTDDAPVEA
ncbi:MAG: HGxxPAAW family protein [Candidatus Nanopelagicales bacterium]